MKSILTKTSFVVLIAVAMQCQSQNDQRQLRADIQSIDLLQGEIALCGTGQFGQVDFSLSCIEKVRKDFNMATALLHSFEYAEAEKVFAKVIDHDPECVMAYWGVAMSNFHPLWAAPTPEELRKGSKIIALARTLEIQSPREAQYVEAIAAIFDNWQELDHKTRVEKFVLASEAIHQQNPDDNEAAIFYALALRASADPGDKSFAKQKRAGEILSRLFAAQPNHPGLAHYLIHTFDYPELAEMALPAARKYAGIAANSAHAQHMPSHIFTRLGLWDESILSNINSMAAAKCYVENLGKEGHWDQELHGLDYLVYAYLQQGKDDKAREQVDYLATIEQVFPITFANAYTFAASPVRYATERKDWKMAADLELRPTTFPWEQFPWQKAIFHFGRSLGAARSNDIKEAKLQVNELTAIHSSLTAAKKEYEATQVQIQIKASEGWILLAEGKEAAAIQSMIAAADMEDKTEKHPVTPGEVVPARELLGDMYMELKDYGKASEAYSLNLRNRPGRFNSVYGCAVAAKNAGDLQIAKRYFQQLLDLARLSTSSRPEIKEAEVFLQST